MALSEWTAASDFVTKARKSSSRAFVVSAVSGLTIFFRPYKEFL